QFANHLPAVLGLPLGATRALGRSCMLNWIGDMPDPAAVLAEAGGHWHDYGKTARPGRKVGHATLRADGDGELADALARGGAGRGRGARVEPGSARRRERPPPLYSSEPQRRDPTRRAARPQL